MILGNAVATQSVAGQAEVLLGTQSIDCMFPEPGNSDSTLSLTLHPDQVKTENQHLPHLSSPFLFPSTSNNLNTPSSPSPLHPQFYPLSLKIPHGPPIPLPIPYPLPPLPPPNPPLPVLPDPNKIPLTTDAYPHHHHPSLVSIAQYLYIHSTSPLQLQHHGLSAV